ncbi:MAG TPA: NAD(P)-dependent oxidoreductase [Afifellaceae bacterium]|nr:NAD(P)-dependent oxidoreductase [Afifellaceae bacterium]
MGFDMGIAGLGVLGSAIAKNMAAGGASVLGYDISEPACAAAAADGVAIADDIRRLASECPVVFTCLPSALALQAAISPEDGLLAVDRPGQIVVEMSTLSIADKEAFREACESHGRRAVDCPVSGNRIMALKKGLTAFCSGERSDFETVEPMLMLFCRKAHFVGPFGCGSKTTFCGNILNLVHNTVAAEVMVLAMKSGLDPKVFHEVISGSGSSSAMFEVRGALMVENDYGREGMNFSVPMKDSRIISEHAASVHCPIPLYQAALQFYHAAVAQGYGDMDAAAVCKVMEKAANVKRG